MTEETKVPQHIKEAFQILGLPEDASKETIEDRYFLLLKKRKTGQNIDLDSVNKAYKAIIDYELERSAQLYEEKVYGDSKAKRAIDNFWHKYKVHVWFTIIVLFVGGMTIQSILENRAEKIALSKLPPPDLDVMYVGEYFHEDAEKLGEDMLVSFPEWQRIIGFLSYNPENPKDQYDIASTQKNMLNLMMQRPDIYIMDQFNYRLLVTQGAFVPLKELGLTGEIPQELLLKGQAEEDPEPYLYGIDVSGSAELFYQWGVFHTNEQFIIAVRYDSERIDQAIQFIRKVVDFNP